MGKLSGCKWGDEEQDRFRGYGEREAEEERRVSSWQVEGPGVTRLLMASGINVDRAKCGTRLDGQVRQAEHQRQNGKKSARQRN